MLRVILKKLFKPLCYLKVKHSQKVIIDIYIPLFVAAVSMFLVSSAPKPIAFMGEQGIISLVNGLLQMLIGFFVASLAAVATFQREGMDEVMKGTPPTLNGEAVTRRQYLCYMFGYLAFMSIVVYFCSGIAEVTIDIWRYLFGELFINIKGVAIFIYFTLVINILLTTFLALHFLTDRIVRDNSVFPDREE